MEREYVIKDHKKLRRGFTTGTCAACAACAAAQILLGTAEDEAGHVGEPLSFVGSLQQIKIALPNGENLILSAECTADEREVLKPHGAKGLPEHQGGSVTCFVKKDSGDDPDITNGVQVYAKVTLLLGEYGKIRIEGGRGIGKVTKPGLACAVGEAAINPVPRKMIEDQVSAVAQARGYEGSMLVTVSVPNGEELAKKTYNPRLGIVGGISILGTGGRVEPMSEKALIDTIRVEMSMRKAQGAKYLLITPGNYGETFLKTTMGLGEVYTVKCSNFIGEALDLAVELGFLGVLFVGHMGKLVKVAAGIMNTHSHYADGRLEVITAHAALEGADTRTVKKLFQCVTTDEALRILDEVGLRENVISSVLEKIDFHMKERTAHAVELGAVMFSNQYGYLGETRDAGAIIKKLSL